MNGLDLFSGYGGLSCALASWVRPIAYCEIDRYAQGILLSRMASGDIPVAPIWDDVKSLDGKQFEGGIVEIIYGGFPCQDISCAGKGAGLEGKRSSLFHEIVRLAYEIEPSFIFLENVPIIRTRGLDTVIEELTEAGYDCRWTMLSACDVGAPHQRERWFLLANAQDIDGKRDIRELFEAGTKIIGSKDKYKDATEQFKYSSANSSVLAKECASSSGAHTWAVEPDVARVADGIAFRLDRVRAIGNGVVPQQAKKAFEILIGIS